VSPSGDVELEVDGSCQVDEPVVMEAVAEDGAKSFGGARLVVASVEDLGSISGAVGTPVTRTVAIAVPGTRRALKASVTGSPLVSAGEMRMQ
jgi:hypothetical protein